LRTSNVHIAGAGVEIQADYQAAMERPRARGLKVTFAPEDEQERVSRAGEALDV